MSQTHLHKSIIAWVWGHFGLLEVSWLDLNLIWRQLLNEIGSTMPKKYIAKAIKSINSKICLFILITVNL
jgi:hypothetical protein